MDDDGMGGPEVPLDSTAVVCNELILWFQIRCGRRKLGGYYYIITRPKTTIDGI